MKATKARLSKPLQFFVIEKYYDNGKSQAAIWPAEKALAEGYFDGYQEENKNYDLYVTGCVDYPEARDWAKGVREA